MALSVQPIRLPVAKAPDSDQVLATADGPLHSIAESGVLLQSLRQSRHAIVTSVFTPFSTTKKRTKDSSFKPPPPHTTVNLGKCTVEIGPHTFAYTTFHEIVYSAAPSTAAASGGSASPITQLKLGTGDVASQTVFSALDPTVRSTLTPDLIDKVNLAAASNPTLAQLLRATATRQASKEQEKTLGVLIQSLARGPVELSSQISGPSAPTQPSLVDTPAPAKRGPGRPPKVASSSSSPALPVAAAGTSASSPPPIKRGPGRPPKPKPIVAADESAQADPPPVKRGPGRPPKPKPAAPEGEVSAQADSAPVKRGPGRPPKPKPIAIPRSDSEGTSAAPAPAKRGPGRPRKSQPVEPESDVENESEAPPPVKRGPGRPAKPKPPPAESGDDDDDDNDDGDSEAAPPPVKRGPGRPPKPKPDGDNPPVKRGPGRPPKAKPAPTSDADATPPVKRGPGRPPKPKPLAADTDKDGASDAGPSIRRSGRFSTASIRPLKELSSSEPESDSSSDGEEAPPPVKRGPGRPPKPKPPPTSPGDVHKEIDADSSVVPPVKRRPGRPPKPKPELSATPGAVGQNPVPDSGSAPLVKRGPGRPPKPKPPVVHVASEHASAALPSIAAPAPVPGSAAGPTPVPGLTAPVLAPTTQETPMDVDGPVTQKEPSQPAMKPGPSTPSTSKPRANAGGQTGHTDIAFEFYENKEVRFLLPKEPVLYTMTDGEICLTTTIEVKVTLPAPALPAAAPSAPDESQEPPAPPPPPPTRVGYQVLRIRLKNVPDNLRVLLEARAADKAQTSQAKKTFKVQKAAAAPRVHLQFRLPDGPVLDQVKAVAFAGPPSKPLQPPHTAAPPKRKRKANPNAAPGDGVKRRRTTVRACAGCNKTDVPLVKDSKFCRECGDSAKAVNAAVASAGASAEPKDKVGEPAGHSGIQTATVESQIAEGPTPSSSIVQASPIRADPTVGST